jgi:hypothetical protein
LNKPIPDDLVKILAKDEDKQRAIIDKSTKDAVSTQARAIGATAALSVAPAVNQPPPATANRVITSTSGNVSGASSTSSKLVSSPSVVAAKVPTPTANKSNRINMVIPPIPPFKGKKSQSASQPSNTAAQPTTKPTGSGASAQSAKAADAADAAKADGAPNKLNVNATPYRPNPKAPAFTPVIFCSYFSSTLADDDDCHFQASPNTVVGPSANSSPKTKPEGVCRNYFLLVQGA